LAQLVITGEAVELRHGCGPKVVSETGHDLLQLAKTAFDLEAQGVKLDYAYGHRGANAHSYRQCLITRGRATRFTFTISAASPAQLKDLLEIVERLQAKNIRLISNKENLDTNTPTGKLMLTMIAAINQFERKNLLERQREGIALAVKQGKYKGRREVCIKDFDRHYKRYMSREVSKSELARELKISRPTLDKLINGYKVV